ncbi:hypothetical protein ACLOJK_012523 [Asimina triloba]
MTPIVFFYDTIRSLISPQAICFVDGNCKLPPTSIWIAHHAGDVGPPLNLASPLSPYAARTKPDSPTSTDDVRLLFHRPLLQQVGNVDRRRQQRGT